MRKYTSDHEWLTVVDDVATVGITDYAVGQLGDLVFIELPVIGTITKKGEAIATVESVKTASEVLAPIDGEVVAINDKIVSDPSIVNQEPLSGGWFFKLKFDPTKALDGLLDEADYAKLIA